MTRYLLDVSALVALGFQEHEFYEQVATWVQTLTPGEEEFATCPITELGFVRVLTQLPEYGFSVADAKLALLRLKSSGRLGFAFLADDHDASRLPGWVKTPKQTTDGHLVQLAKAKDAILVTLDRGIPGAFLIPRK
jgi:predicted nucleic acid-binding protein